MKQYIMQNKEKIIEILVDTLQYCYCDNCKHNDNETYKDGYCDGCYIKYSNWALSPAAAEKIVDKITQLGEVYPIFKERVERGLK